MLIASLYDDQAGKLGVTLGRDGVERSKLTKPELDRLVIHSQAIKADCSCNFAACLACREIAKLQYYTKDYQIVKALVDELAELRGSKETDPTATLEEMVDGIIRINFDDSEVMCSTFLRFQEYYESPEFANKIFSLDEFKEWYRDGGEFTYCTDWSGFNIPSWVLTPFLEGKFNPLSHQEQWFLRLFRWRRSEGKLKDFYIIGTHGDGSESLKHETAHGLFYVNPDYKSEVQEVLKELKSDTRKAIEEYLVVDYHENSLEDEVHAYTLEELATLDVAVTEDVEMVSNKLCEIYDRYWKEANDRKSR